MAKKDANLDYDPLALDEQRSSFRDDPVKLNMTDGKHDPVNDDPDPMRHLDDQYVPSNQSFERTSSQKDI